MIFINYIDFDSFLKHSENILYLNKQGIEHMGKSSFCFHLDNIFKIPIFKNIIILFHIHVNKINKQPLLYNYQ